MSEPDLFVKCPTCSGTGLLQVEAASFEAKETACARKRHERAFANACACNLIRYDRDGKASVNERLLESRQRWEREELDAIAAGRAPQIVATAD